MKTENNGWKAFRKRGLSATQGQRIVGCVKDSESNSMKGEGGQVPQKV